MDRIWSEVKAAIKSSVAEHSFLMWVEPIKFIGCHGNKVVLACPNFFSRKRILEHFSEIIETEFAGLLGDTCEVCYEIDHGSAGATASPHAQQIPLPNIGTGINSGRLLCRDFTFDRFVVANNNDFAFSAALSLASCKQKDQNSLYLLSGTGMGKSHLSQAIGNHVLTEFPSERVYYTTAEDFSHEMVDAYRQKNINQFKDKYRNGCDVLLLEDIHFLSGKNRTQIELSFSLDSLLEMGKKIIFSSIYPPGEIPGLDEKLKSRLSCSLISQIDAPNFRTRVRILKSKATANGHVIPDPVIEYLAGELTQDVRQLESGMNHVAAKSRLMGVPIDLGLAESVVKNIVSLRKSVTIETIKKMVCREFQISTKDIVSPSRKKGVVRPRQIAMFLARRYTDSPLQMIGKSFNRYHATVLHSINAVEKESKTRGPLYDQLKYLCKKIEKGKV